MPFLAKNAWPWSEHEKPIDSVTGELHSTIQNVKGHERQGKIEELSQVEGDERVWTTKCNAGSQIDIATENGL